jgi:molybdopterin-guanine dinucleotide biosynthesis protein A/predicted nucleotidyltransferase
VADRGLTGILLVGGASRRFGSPKALEVFGGETLAERAWRLLGEVCEERIAVGKEGDGLELPFPVLDDGTSERAPVYGLLAGLRAASFDVCIALPVDCPLVSADLLRSLAEAQAVPQTGPLPGAYERAHIAELERRLAAGERSLRGVNSRVVDTDEKLLANINTRSDLLAVKIADWARNRIDVHAAVVVGSQARAETAADRWSDLDVVLVVEDPDSYLADLSWVSAFGVALLTFVEPTAVGNERELRVLFETGEDLDLPLIPVSGLERLTEDEEIAEVVGRGYRVLVDDIGLEERLRTVAPGPHHPPAPTQREFRELASDFWYHALWAAKKLRRGEVFVATECLDGYLKARFVRLLEWHARAVDPAVDTWHGGRFLERWGDPGALVALEFAYARYSLPDAARALWATIDLWQGVEEETAQRLGLAMELDHADLRRRIAAVVPDPRAH